MKNLENLIEEFDTKCQEIIRELMDMEFREYKEEIKWEKILVYKEFEEIVSKMLYKGCTWYFGKAVYEALNSEYKCRGVRIAVYEREEGKRIEIGRLYLTEKKFRDDKKQKVDKTARIFLKKAEIEEIMK